MKIHEHENVETKMRNGRCVSDALVKLNRYVSEDELLKCVNAPNSAESSNCIQRELKLILSDGVDNVFIVKSGRKYAISSLRNVYEIDADDDDDNCELIEQHVSCVTVNDSDWETADEDENNGNHPDDTRASDCILEEPHVSLVEVMDSDSDQEKPKPSTSSGISRKRSSAASQRKKPKLIANVSDDWSSDTSSDDMLDQIFERAYRAIKRRYGERAGKLARQDIKDALRNVPEGKRGADRAKLRGKAMAKLLMKSGTNKKRAALAKPKTDHTRRGVASAARKERGRIPAIEARKVRVARGGLRPSEYMQHKTNPDDTRASDCILEEPHVSLVEVMDSDEEMPIPSTPSAMLPPMHSSTASARGTPNRQAVANGGRIIRTRLTRAPAKVLVRRFSKGPDGAPGKILVRRLTAAPGRILIRRITRAPDGAIIGRRLTYKETETAGRGARGARGTRGSVGKARTRGLDVEPVALRTRSASAPRRSDRLSGKQCP